MHSPNISPNTIRTLLLSEAITSIRKNNAKYINYVGNLMHLTTKEEILQLAQSFSSYFIMVEMDITRTIKAIDDKDLLAVATINQEKQPQLPLLVTLNHCNTYPNYPFSSEKPKNVAKVLINYEKAFTKIYGKDFNSKTSTPEKVKNTYLKNRIKV